MEEQITKRYYVFEKNGEMQVDAWLCQNQFYIWREPKKHGFQITWSPRGVTLSIKPKNEEIEQHYKYNDIDLFINDEKIEDFLSKEKRKKLIQKINEDIKKIENQE